MNRLSIIKHFALVGLLATAGCLAQSGESDQDEVWESEQVSSVTSRGKLPSGKTSVAETLAQPFGSGAVHASASPLTAAPESTDEAPAEPIAVAIRTSAAAFAPLLTAEPDSTGEPQGPHPDPWRLTEGPHPDPWTTGSTSSSSSSSGSTASSGSSSGSGTKP